MIVNDNSRVIRMMLQVVVSATIVILIRGVIFVLICVHSNDTRVSFIIKYYDCKWHPWSHQWVTPQFGTSLTFINYAPRVIDYAPGVIIYAPREHLKHWHYSWRLSFMIVIFFIVHATYFTKNSILGTMANTFPLEWG
jgi:hypothetical protein